MGQTNIEEYEMNPFTMFIKPVVYGSRIYTEVVEIRDQFLSPFTPLEIVEHSCEYFGATLKAKKEGSTLLTGVTHKVPIVIDSMNQLYFFPTSSPNRPDCMWVAYDHVNTHHRHSASETLVVFQDKQSFIFPISYHSFENQLMRTAFLRSKIIQRQEMFERKSFYLLNRNQKMEASEQKNPYSLGNK